MGEAVERLAALAGARPVTELSDPDGWRYRLKTGGGKATWLFAEFQGVRQGEIAWDPETGEIDWVGVPDRLRRKGNASRMLHKARGLDPKVHHSSAHPPEGARWAKSLPGSLTFDLRDPDPQASSDLQAGLYAMVDGKEVGGIGWWKADSWRGPKGQITGVYVDPAYQRQGIATALFAEARKHEPDLRHSTSLTEQGKRWKASLRDGDGDGYVDDGKPTHRPAGPQ